jgi:hypothetical protein
MKLPATVTLAGNSNRSSAIVARRFSLVSAKSLTVGHF